ncbi:hypothetical protein pb186bvf_012931 [Paramecium bursaria]
MEYQLELANKKIEELQQQLLAKESKEIYKVSDLISQIEVQNQKLTDQNTQIQLLKSNEQRLIQQLSYFEQQLAYQDKQLQQQSISLEEKINIIQTMKVKFNTYLDQVEDRNKQLEEHNVLLAQKCQQSTCELEYLKRTLNSQIDNIKNEFQIKLVEAQDKIIKLQRFYTKDQNKENSNQNSRLKCTMIDERSNRRSTEKSISIQSDQIYDIQSELNKNIKLLNTKLRQYSSKQ